MLRWHLPMRWLAETIRAPNARWLLLAGAFMLAYAAVTPPFQGPDEVGHFWRSYSLARGAVWPAMEHGRPVADVPRGVRDLVGTLWVDTAGKSGEKAKIGMARLRAAVHVPLRHRELVRVGIPAHYTPVPYLPQTLACLAGDSLRLRPLVTFYLGRLFNASCALVLIGLAMRFADDRWPWLAVSLLPMLLYLCGSWSADPATDGLAFLVTALALRRDKSPRLWWSFLGCSLLLALAKPAYFPLPCLGLAQLGHRRVARAALLGTVIAIGVLISSLTAQRNFFAMRTDRPVDPSAQEAAVRSAPLHFLGIATHDYVVNGATYLEQFAGRLGWLDVYLPHGLIDAALALLLLIGLTTRSLPWRQRLLAAAVVAASLLLVSLSQYVGWSVVGSEEIEGIQGRYFLPTGPLILLLVSISARWERSADAVRVLFVATAIVLNVIAIGSLVQRYWLPLG
jgi:uncharacterized membrane protein